MNTTQARITKNTHMTLGELKSMVEPTTGKEVPTKRKLIESGLPVDTYRNGGYSITVFPNGFALAQSGKRYTVVRVDECRDYTYKVTGGFLAGTVDATPHHFNEEYFLDKPWPLRIMMEADDQFQENEDGREQRLLSKHPDIPDRLNVLREGCRKSVEDIVISQMERERILESLTPKQKEAVILYYEVGYNLNEIGQRQGISKVAVHNRLTAAAKKIAKQNKFKQL